MRLVSEFFKAAGSKSAGTPKVDFVRSGRRAVVRRKTQPTADHRRGHFGLRRSSSQGV